MFARLEVNISARLHVRLFVNATANVLSYFRLYFVRTCNLTRSVYATRTFGVLSITASKAAENHV